MPVQYSTVDCVVVANSSDAVLLRFEAETDDEQELWVPNSAIYPHDLEAYQDGSVDWSDMSELPIATWWLDKNAIGF